MRKTLIALTALAGLIGLAAAATQAAPVRAPVKASSVHQAEKSCGVRCQSAHHRHAQARQEPQQHHSYYSYVNGYDGSRSYYHYH
jgi:hypothetical protein